MPQSSAASSDIHNLINNSFFLVLVALLFPPLPVVICVGFSADLIINILLCILGGFPGLIHAWYIIYRTNKQQSYLPIVEQQSNRENQQVSGQISGGYVGGYGATQNNQHNQPIQNNQNNQNNQSNEDNEAGPSTQPPPYAPPANNSLFLDNKHT